MKLTLRLFVCLLLILPAGFTVHAQHCAWSRQSMGNLDPAQVLTVADGSGNSYVAGTFDSPDITFGSTTLYNATGTSTNIFVVKYDASGTVQWAKRFGGSLADYVSSMTLTSSGQIVIYGSYTSSSVTFDTATLTNVSGYDNFLVALNSAGNVVWAHNEAESASTAGNDQAVAVGTDNAGNIYVCGFYDSAIYFGGSVNAIAASGLGGVYIARYTSAGTPVWAATTGGDGGSVANAMAIDDAGNIYITGNISGNTMTFDGYTLSNAGGNDIFIAKYNSSGSARWAKSIEDSCGSSINDMGTDAAGNVYGTGNMSCHTMKVGSITLTNVSTSGGSNIFTTKFDTSGNFQWAKSSGGIADDGGIGIDVDNDGNAIIAGAVTSPGVVIGPDTLTQGMFLAKYNPSGSVVWAKGSSATGFSFELSVARDGSGNVITSGFFNNYLSIDTSSLHDTSSASFEFFTAKFSDPTEAVPAITHATTEVSLFPNPAHNTINLQSLVEPINQLHVTNMVGQAVYNIQMCKCDNAQVDISSWPTGIYFVQVNGGMVKKFVKE